MGAKKTNVLPHEEQLNLLAVARGDKLPTTLFKNVTLLNLVNGDQEVSNIALTGSHIAGVGLEYDQAEKVIDAKGLYAVPGFIDGHVHIESSLMHPFEFEKMTLPLGTTTAICDPHEITNVLGAQGFEWFLRCSSLMQQNLFVQVSSCVPALAGVETNGGAFTASEMKKYRDNPSVLGLAEMMNFPGVIHADEDVLNKMRLFQEESMGVDGHCPMVRSKELNAYLAAGVRNCHESVSKEEALEKLKKGMSIIIREGSVAKNLKELAPIVNEFNSCLCFLCSDDRNPYDIYNEGHIGHMIKIMIKELNIPAHVAYRLSSFSAAKHFSLSRLGLIAPGYQADLIFLEDLENVTISDVYIKGKNIKSFDFSKNSKALFEKSLPPVQNSIKRKYVSGEDFSLSLSEGIYNVIGVIADAIVTDKLQVTYGKDGFEKSDILKMAVIERYGKSAPVSLGLVHGIGLKSGAMATSVCHDSHNIMVIGCDDDSMAMAVNSLIDSAGGFCFVDKGECQEILQLPLAGLMSLNSAEDISEKIAALKKCYKESGGTLEEPFLQMAFLALPVIPHLKLTDQGLFDVDLFSKIELKSF
jgi:adenine deaminase